MVASPVFRVLLAAYLALWTPAWCCCAIRGGLGAISGMGGATCEADRCCAATPVKPAQRSPESSCCNAASGRLAGDLPSDAQCRCHEIGNDRTRFDTSAKIALPSLSIALAMLPSPAVVAPALDCEGVAMPMASRLDLPPPTSLLAQHCLLII